MSYPAHSGNNKDPEADLVRPTSVGDTSDDALGLSSDVPSLSQYALLSRDSLDDQMLSPKMMQEFGAFHLTDENGGSFDLKSDLHVPPSFKFDSVSDAQTAALAKVFGMHPHQVERMMESAMLKMMQPPMISDSEKASTINEARQACGSALAKICSGSANPGDLGSLLSNYVDLGRFPEGSSQQAYVADAMNRIHSVLAAAAANRAHPSGLSFAEVLHRRLNADQVYKMSRDV